MDFDSAPLEDRAASYAAAQSFLSKYRTKKYLRSSSAREVGSYLFQTAWLGLIVWLLSVGNQNGDPILYLASIVLMAFALFTLGASVLFLVRAVRFHGEVRSMKQDATEAETYIRKTLEEIMEKI